MLDQVLAAFRITPDIDLDLMQLGQTLSALSGRMIAGLEKTFSETQPSLAIVQGDTTTTLCGALCAFYARVPVAHVEAGLRTFDLQSPFPEEMNRVVTSRLASLHFAATEGAAQNLRQEGVAQEQILVTGNTGIDAVLATRSGLESGRLQNNRALPIDPQRRIVVVTAHRRESFGDGFEGICQAVAKLARRPDIQVVWPLHPNPNVRSAVERTLRGNAAILFTEPLDYVPFVDLLRQATLVLTDSGGIQEEGPSLGKPVLVLREKTERPEAVSVGTVKLVGTDPAMIVQEATRLLDDPVEYARMAKLHNPYGDGQASARIVQRLDDFFGAKVSRAKGQAV